MIHMFKSIRSVFPAFFCCFLIGITSATAKDSHYVGETQPKMRPQLQKTTSPAQMMEKTSSPFQTIVNQNAPDLVIELASWIDHIPNPGDTVGVNGVYKISIKNIGKATANSAIIRYSGMSLGGPAAPAALSGILTCPPLLPGRTSMLAWPPISTEKWWAGKYRLRVELDTPNSIPESNESNNTKTLDFMVIHPVPLGSSVNQQPPAISVPVETANKKPDLIIQQIKIEPNIPSPNDELHIFITYRNVGEAVSGEVSGTWYSFYRTGSDGVRHHIEGSNLLSMPYPLNPGEIRVFSWGHKLTPSNSNDEDQIVRSGDTIELALEIENNLTSSIPESNETNNTKSITFTLH